MQNLMTNYVVKRLLGLVLLLGIGATYAPMLSVSATPQLVWQGADVETALTSLGYSSETALRLERLTAYNPVSWQTDDDPDTASCGPIRPDGLALSRDLFFDATGHKHLCGAKVMLLVINPDTDKVEALEERVIWDTMHTRYEDTGDVFLDTLDEALAFDFGVKQGVVVFLDDTEG
mgnify:CR=1 FL=1